MGNHGVMMPGCCLFVGRSLRAGEPLGCWMPALSWLCVFAGGLREIREVAGSVSRTIKHLLIIGLLSISGACGKCGKFSPPQHKKAGNMPAHSGIPYGTVSGTV